MNTLGGLPVDRLPVFAVLGAYGGKLTNTDLRTLFSDASAYVAGQKAVQDTFGFDLVLSAFDYSVIAEAFGGEVAWSADQVPNMRRPAVRKAADALLLPLPDVMSTGRLPVVLEINRQLAKRYKEQVPIISVLPGPCILPSLLVGIDQWMEAVLFDQQLAQKLLDYTAPFFVSWANALLAEGADCLVITEGMATASIAPRDMFASQFLPHLRNIFGQIKGSKVLSSTGGCMNHVLDLLPGLDGLVGVITGSKDDLTESRKLIGPDMTIIGALDNLTLPAVSADAVYEMSLAQLRTAAPSGRYILANAGADIPQATPAENLRAMRIAVADYSAATGNCP
ncbi:MAG: uroporphyrinogen decarboxylase family protein [Desulfuromonadaceae bacterium]|nr:uroporphyrinogen decarboxylase family protein [Desulfuromonadaceae bacterium]